MRRTYFLGQSFRNLAATRLVEVAFLKMEGSGYIGVISVRLNRTGMY